MTTSEDMLRRVVGRRAEWMAGFAPAAPRRSSLRRFDHAILACLRSAPRSFVAIDDDLRRRFMAKPPQDILAGLARLEASGLVVRTGERWEASETTYTNGVISPHA